MLEKAALVLRPDGRAAGRAPPGRAVGAHHGRVLPRRAAAGRAAVHRQHLPVHPGRLRGVHAARPHALGRGLPAHPGRRDGRAAGAHHLDPGPLDHLAAGRVRARRRLHRPGAVHELHPLRRHHRAEPRHRRARHLPGGRPARLDVDHPRPRGRRRAPLQRGPARCSRSCSATRSCRTSSPSSGSTSSPRRTRSPSPGPARSSGSCPSRCTSPRCSPACPASPRRSTRRSTPSRRWSTATSTTCPSRRSSTSVAPTPARSKAERAAQRLGRQLTVALEVQVVSPERILWTGRRRDGHRPHRLAAARSPS